LLLCRNVPTQVLQKPSGDNVRFHLQLYHLLLYLGSEIL
jgi:hypothetical protein